MRKGEKPKAKLFLFLFLCFFLLQEYGGAIPVVEAGCHLFHGVSFGVKSGSVALVET